MVLRVSLSPGPRRSFRPGEEFRASVEVANESDRQSTSAFDILIASFSVEVISTERIDHTWVALAYGADVPPTDKDNRRETREIFRSRETILAANRTLRPGEKYTWNIRMIIPEWLPPSFRGISARYGHLLRAVVRFTGTPAAMQQLTKHLSLETSRRASSGSLLRLENQGNLRTGKAGKGRILKEQKLEKTAVAKVPILVLPIQRIQTDFSERPGGLNFPGLIMGDDSELLPIPYSHSIEADTVIESQEVSSQLQSPFKALSNLQPTSKLAGQQLSTSALQNSPAATPGRSVPPQGHAEEEFSRWGQQKHQLSRESHNGASASGRLEYGRESIDSDRLAQGVPATPMTGVEAPLLRSYNLRISDNMLARLTLHPPMDGPLCLGATLCGTVDFSASQEAASADPSLPKCIQMMVLLETEEKMQARWSVATSQLTSSGVRQVQDEHQELTPNTLMTHFMLSVPQDAPASFSTSLISLRWILRFEFLTTSKPASVGWLGGGGKSSEQISWVLPILVKPSRF